MDASQSRNKIRFTLLSFPRTLQGNPAGRKSQGHTPVMRASHLYPIIPKYFPLPRGQVLLSVSTEEWTGHQGAFWQENSLLQTPLPAPRGGG